MYIQLFVKVMPGNLEKVNTLYVDGNQFPREYFLADKMYKVLEVKYHIINSTTIISYRDGKPKRLREKEKHNQAIYYLIKTENDGEREFPAKYLNVISSESLEEGRRCVSKKYSFNEGGRMNKNTQ